MTVGLGLYKCEICGNIVEVLHTGAGELVCCGEPMALQKENTVDAAKEKHVPVVDRSGGPVTVRVGSVPHPMTEDHYIAWIELVDGSNVCRKTLSPGGSPEATFGARSGTVTAREYCTLHGHWSSKG